MTSTADVTNRLLTTIELSQSSPVEFVQLCLICSQAAVKWRLLSRVFSADGLIAINTCSAYPHLSFIDAGGRGSEGVDRDSKHKITAKVESGLGRPFDVIRVPASTRPRPCVCLCRSVSFWPRVCILWTTQSLSLCDSLAAPLFVSGCVPAGPG